LFISFFFLGTCRGRQMGGSYDSVKACCNPDPVNDGAIMLVRVLMCRYNMMFAVLGKLLCKGRVHRDSGHGQSRSEKRLF
jgi:hypothetical protein